MIASFALALAVVAGVNAQCTNPRIRSEWGQLTADQKALYVQANVALANRPASGQYADPSKMGWHDFVQTHSHQAYWAHGNAQFYPYHRAMVWQFENALISTGIWPSNMGVPYFDWSAMSQNWWTSDIFTDQYFGAISGNDPDYCILTGAFAKGKYNVAPDYDNHRVVTGDQTCARRDASKKPLTDAITITQSLGASSFVEFTRQAPGVYYDSTNYHADGHGVFGGANGDMANPSVSPNDPVFWLHHGLVDKYWWRWQQLCPAFRQDTPSAYGGNLMRADDPMGGGTTNAASNQYVESWPFLVSQLLDTQGGTLCYTYTQSGGDLQPPAVNCPAAATNNNTMIPPAPATVNTLDDTWLKMLFNSLITPKLMKNWNQPNNFGGPVTTSGSNVVQPAVVIGRDVVNATVNHNDTTHSSTLDVNATATASMQAKSTIPNSSLNKNSTSTVFLSSNSTLASTSTYSATPSTTSIPQNSTVVEEKNNEYLEKVHSNGTVSISYTQADHEIQVSAGHKIVNVYHGYVDTIGPDGTPKRFFPPVPAVEYVANPDAPTGVEVGAHPCYLAVPDLMPRHHVEKMGMDWQSFLNAHLKEKMRIDEYNAANCTGEVSPSSLLNWL